MKKNTLYATLSATLMLSLLFMVSCNKSHDSRDNQYFSLATVIPQENAPGYSLRLDDGKTIWANHTNGSYTPKQTHRAFVTYTLTSDKYPGYDYVANVLELRNVLTKKIAKNEHAENDKIYGIDPIRILNMWVGDDYLNVEFQYNHGGNPLITHYINLVPTDDADSLFFEFRHHAYDDRAITIGRGIVAFDLSTLNVKDDAVTLRIKVSTFDGNKEYTQKYQPKTTMAISM